MFVLIMCLITCYCLANRDMIKLGREDNFQGHG